MMDDFIEKYTEEKWIPLNKYSRLRENFKIQKEEIKREDSFIQFGQFNIDYFFETFLAATQAVITYNNTDIYSQIEFSMSFNSNSYERQIYDILGLFGDIGGLVEATLFLSVALIYSWQRINLESALVSKLFRVKYK